MTKAMPSGREPNLLLTVAVCCNEEASLRALL
jgi:hypothetical protein